ncbi:hypothetical protein [Actinomyces haliotis]|uniref:hypothetical protein n=1 Tax=Actinomyces haliotis TaxID=1280843 RepID=UPI001E565540|nr:hypothetical protein [Actinomyces haliotis]
MTLAEAWRADSVLLAAAATRRCERCLDAYPDDGEALCPLCRAQARSPFPTEVPPEAASRLPPDVLAAIRRSRGLD